MRILILLILVPGVIAITGCQQGSAGVNTPLVDTASPDSALPTQGAIQMTPSTAAPSDPQLQDLIHRTKEDLANRLVVPTDGISLVEITEAEWSDSSLDCPQPGMEYLQVITPGYRILLEAGDQVYEYHSNRDTYFVYCENQFPSTGTKP